MLRIIWFLVLFYLIFKGLHWLFRLIEQFQRQRRHIRHMRQEENQSTSPTVIHYPNETSYQGGDEVEYEEIL